jgi:putative tryptophan/tyrosine transport system substrate-binding protein
MRRRAFLYGSAATLAGPRAGEAQHAGKVYRVGTIAGASPISELVGTDPVNPAARAFVHGLRDLGYVQGKNLVLETRSAEGRLDRVDAIVRELVRLQCDVIVTSTNATTRVAKDVTQTVPIVMVSSTPVEEGLVQSLSRPGGDLRPMPGPRCWRNAWSC